MAFAVSDVLDFVRDNDVKFVRLAFCNLLGEQKNIAIMADMLPAAFDRGMRVEIDLADGFAKEPDADVFLYPDPATLAILPWRPTHGRVVRLFCDIRCGGEPYQGDGRRLLRETARRAALAGVDCRISPAFEFFLFELDQNGAPTRIPQDQAGQFDVAPLDKGENVRREICLALEDMGLAPEGSHHCRYPGQNLIALTPMGALETADALVSLRGVGQVVAARNGLHACYEPNPLFQAGHSSVRLTLEALPSDRDAASPDPVVEAFFAGAHSALEELAVFFNTMPGSYDRFADMEEPRPHLGRYTRPPRLSGACNRLELRFPDPSLTPYFALALLLEAGLRQVEGKCPDRQARGAFPRSLGQAVEWAQASPLVNSVLPPRALSAFCTGRLRAHRTAARPEL